MSPKMYLISYGQFTESGNHPHGCIEVFFVRELALTRAAELRELLMGGPYLGQVRVTEVELEDGVVVSEECDMNPLQLNGSELFFWREREGEAESDQDGKL